jgi:hypothetical protein
VDLSYTSWDGTENGEWSKGTRYLRSPDDTATVKGQLQPPLNRPVERSAGTGAQSHDDQDLPGHQPAAVMAAGCNAGWSG